LSPGWGEGPADPSHSRRFSLNVVHLLSTGSRMQIAPPSIVRGRGEGVSLPAFRGSAGYAPGAPPAGPPALLRVRPRRPPSSVQSRPLPR
jgi:hypothetical protein